MDEGRQLLYFGGTQVFLLLEPSLQLVHLPGEEKGDAVRTWPVYVLYVVRTTISTTVPGLCWQFPVITWRRSAKTVSFIAKGISADPHETDIIICASVSYSL